ncbi:MAG TPA: DUF1735 domain-containing protein [Chitinophagaceae bacterium]|nr:DUF1735 domain-containing protein [Chitinophagaceae bacterium]
MKRYIGFLIITGLILLSSCVKEDPPLGSKGSKSVVEFYNEVPDLITSLTSSTYPSYNFDLIFEENEQPFDIEVSYSGADAGAPQDIEVTVAIDPGMIDVYNTQNSLSLSAMTGDVFKADSWKVTIPKGQKRATLKGKILKSAYDFSKSYGLPLRITNASAGQVSGNYSAMVFRIQARNSYDGIYLMEATAPMVDVTSSSLTGWYPISMQLITYSGNSVALYDGINYTNAYGHPIRSGSSGSYYGSFSPIFFIDEATGAITVKNYYGELSGGSQRSCVLDPTGVNKATFNSDGSIKSFEVSYIMTQGAAYTPRTFFHEKFTYKEPR